MIATIGTGPAAGALAAWLALAALIDGGSGGGAAPPAAEPGAATDQGTAVDLDDYLWANRLVLIFAPTAQDAGYAEQLATFADREAEIADRDLLIGRLPADATGSFDDQIISGAGIAALRERLGVADGEFAVLLIGKDGGVKLRSDVPLTADRIFATIDSMPMRQREMR